MILIIFGIGTIAIGIAGKNTVEDELSQEKIVGSPDMSPEGIAPGIVEANLSLDAPDCDVAVEPIKNPVTKEPESVRVEHATGFIFKSAEAVSAKECRIDIPGLSFAWPDKAGFVTRINYGN